MSTANQIVLVAGAVSDPTEYTFIPTIPTDAASAILLAWGMVANSGLTEQEVDRSTCAVLVVGAACTALPPAPVTDAYSAPRECIVITAQDEFVYADQINL